LTLSAKSLHAVGRTIPKASFLTGTAEQTLGLFDRSSLFSKPLIASGTVSGKSLLTGCPPEWRINVLQLPEGGDFEALHCQPSTNFDRSRKLDLTNEPPLLGRCCYVALFVFSFNFFNF